MQKLNLSNQINIAMREVTSSQLTAGMLSSNFNEKVREFVASNPAFTFMNSIEGTPAYWKKFLFDVLAMVKQLGVPTFFMTVSSAVLKWNELVSIINKLHKLNMSEEDIENLSYHDRCHLLNSNPVLVARYFQYRVDVFFNEIVVDGPLAKTKYCAIHVEFQVHGSPHVHCLLSVGNAPVLTSKNKEECVAFVNQIVHAFLPDRNENPELHNLVKLYQLHRHSRKCRKNKNEPCRFKFGKFFSKETIFSEPLPENVSEEIKVLVLRKRNKILGKVRDYINNFRNPSKINFYDPTRDDFIEVKSVSEVLEELSITEQEYENALKISDDNSYQLHLRRPTNSCFVNNYFDIGLLAWEANIDIQPVFDYYKSVTHMCSYLPKHKDECSQAIKQAFKESLERGAGSYEQMKSVAHVYVSKRECSQQEAVYQVMPELWLRKVFLGVLYASSNIPEKRVRIMMSKKEIIQLPEESTDIYKRNMTSRHLIRPHKEMFEPLCYALFI